MPLGSNTPANRYGSIAAETYDIDKPAFALPDTASYVAQLRGVTGPAMTFKARRDVR